MPHEANTQESDKAGERTYGGTICVEVGSRGFTNFSWQLMSSAVGMTKTESKTLRKRVATVAVRCSYYLWLHQTFKAWSHPKLVE